MNECGTRMGVLFHVFGFFERFGMSLNRVIQLQLLWERGILSRAIGMNSVCYRLACTGYTRRRCCRQTVIILVRMSIGTFGVYV